MFGIYVHFPYCKSKCPYCDFASFAVNAIPDADYADAVLREIEMREGDFSGRAVSLYFGGGTPSLWKPEHVRRVVDAARWVGLAGDAEVTIEANPGDLETVSLAALRHAGVNRVSFGCQSFDDRHLATLGRRHDAAAALAAPRAAREAGFDNVALDFIFGIPGQTLDGWRRDLDRAIALGPNHLSLYSLSLELEVPMAKAVAGGRLRLADEALHAAMFEHARATARDAGFRHYEISNYARRGHEAVHNSLYWIGTPIMAVGAGAWGYEEDSSPRRRYGNVKVPGEYLARMNAGGGDRPEAFRETIDESTHLREAVMTGLRLIEGIDLAAFVRRTGVDLLQRFAEPIDRLRRQGLLRVKGGRIALSDRALFVMNEVVLAFF